VIEVMSGRHRNSYIVDLRGLFVAGLSSSRSLSLRQTRDPIKSEEDGNRRLWEEIESAMGGVQLIYRPKGPLAEGPLPAQALLKSTIQF
jgi:hypothetical protein